MDVKKENNKYIASKKVEMQMVINNGKDFIKSLAHTNGWRNDEQQQQYYFMLQLLSLLEELVNDFYKTELDSVDQKTVDQLFQKITTREDNPKPNSDIK